MLNHQITNEIEFSQLATNNRRTYQTNCDAKKRENHNLMKEKGKNWHQWLEKNISNTKEMKPDSRHSIQK